MVKSYNILGELTASKNSNMDDPDDGSSKLLQNVCTYIHIYTLSYPS